MRSAVRTLARSRPQNYTGLNSARDVQLRIIARSTYSAICGAPHIAEFERELIRARTSEGRARAKARGQSLGRPHKLTLHQRREVLQRKDAGESTREIARSYAVSPSTISRLTAL